MSHQAKKPSGFTLIELLVVISIIALLLGILVPVLGIAKKNAVILKEGTSLRNIHVGCVAYGAGNKDWFPGLTAVGKNHGWNPVTKSATPFRGKYFAATTNNGTALVHLGSSHVSNTTAYAQAVLMDEGFTTPAQWISPGETSRAGGNRASLHVSGLVFEALATKGTSTATSAATANSTTGMVSVYNSSYAVLAYGFTTLKPEWKSNQNQKAIVLGSRLMGTSNTAFDANAANSFFSLWTDFRGGTYKGPMVRGDSSTTTEAFKRTDPAAPFGTLKYGAVTAIPAGLVPNPNALVVGPFAYASNISAATPGIVAATSAGNTVVAGRFTRGQIASGLD